MGSYVPSTSAEQEEMLKVCGIKSTDELYVDVPHEMMIKGPLNLPDPMSELEVRDAMSAIAAKNRIYKTILRGAGAYDHYIPATVDYITSKEEFLTAYTPYQAEISQGVLQSIFEYQTLMCEMTGMDVSNAGVYDGASAAAESITCCRDRKRNHAYVSATVNPDVIATMKTYCFGSDVELTVVPAKDGVTDMAALAAALGDDAACFYSQQPNFYGIIEDCSAIAETVHAAGAKFVMGINPIAAFALKTPRECGADFAVGEGQPLGMPLCYGGPYLGFMTTTEKNGRKLPGRIVGQTTDLDGARAFVLTLQAREQHIRREKATSNICSNEALCATRACVYLSTMGPQGMKKVTEQSYSKAHYFADALCSIKGISMKYAGEFFDEFLTDCSGHEDAIVAALDKAGVLAGLPVDGGLLWCVTEKVSKATLDEVIDIVKGVF